MKTCYVLLLIWGSTSVVFGQDRWVWSTSNAEKRSRSLQGFTPTTPEPPITTFRPATRARSSFRGGFIPSFFHNGLPNNPFFPDGFFPFEFVPSDVPKVNEDGTTKSRVPADTAALDSSSGAPLAPNDKYTTLDRLQRERGPAPTFPPPQRHQLGGLHPDEVFYADDNLLIIRGGGFGSEAFQEPSQPLDGDGYDEDESFNESTIVDSSASPPPSDQEYNGNIPVIVPPPEETKDRIPVVLPHQFRPSPLSIFVGGSSNKDYVFVPFVDNSKANIALKPITHNHLNPNNRSASSKLRREASAIIPYVYPAPANTFVHLQPTYQQQGVVQSHVTLQQTPTHQSHVQTSHQVLQSRPSVHREPLHQYQPVLLQQTAPQPQSNYVIQGFPVQHTPAAQAINDQQYYELELQPENVPVYHSLEGDTRVNFLPPFPSRNTEAELYTPQFQRIVVPNHFVVPGITSVQRKPVSRPSPVYHYSEIEIQPENPPVFRVHGGDTNVNHYPPLPRRNPEAEAIQPQYHNPAYINLRQQTHKPRV